MYLKSLTLKGFKSFASSTTLQLEPGITCIVGPNGSGKSNVVDALAWVMGEASAKSLRGGKMDDVIFAGTSGRPPLGRAEVLLTIDNSDGALPIEYAEVTISRTMFRSGGSEYAINGSSCRLLDVQELLSDSGIGREMHVIVGQGQLDTILHATPEDRRGFIEEAAGVLKHRKRKEKALRKLDSTEGNLNRLADLLNEIRRQLKPLGRQAEVARKAAAVQADVRDARARLMADDLVTARTSLEQELADESVLLERREQVEAAIAAARETEAALEAALREDLPALSAAQETWFSLSGLRERLRGTQSLAAERVRNAAGTAESEDTRSGRDPEQLEAEAERVREQEQRIAAEVDGHRTALEQAVAARKAAEDAARRGGAPDRRAPARGRRSARGAGPAARAGQRAEVPRRRRRRRAGPAHPGPRGRRDPRRAGPARLHRAGDQGRRPRRRRGGARRRARGRERAARRHRGAARQGTRRGPAGRPGPDGAAGPQGRPRDGAQPQGRRRRPAGGLRLGLRPAGLGGRAALGPPGLRGGRGRRPRLGCRRGRGRATPTLRSARSGCSRTTTSVAPACCWAPGRAATTASGPGCPATRRTPWTWWSAPRRCGPAWPGCCSRWPWSTTSPRPGAWSPTSRTSPPSPARATCSAPTSPRAAPPASRA